MEAVLAPPAFVSELMGLTVYQQLDGVLDDILDDEPEARERVRTLLRDVMTDELAHVASAVTSLVPRVSAWLTSWSSRCTGPSSETTLFFDVEQMVQAGKAFDYSTIAPEMIEESWVPSYCKA